MEKKQKKSIGNTDTPIVIQEKGGSSGVALPLIGIGALFLGYKFVLQPYFAQHAENKAEGDTTPEGQVANQFKSVFGPKDSANWVVNDSDYQAAALLLTNENKKLVYEKYHALTDRNLSDDIAKHISADVQSKSAKIQQYNSKPGKLFSITPDGKVRFEIVKGDKIRFAPGQTTPVVAYLTYFGPIFNELKNAPNGKALIEKINQDPKLKVALFSIAFKPTAKEYSVTSVKEVPYSSFQNAEGWTKYLRPFVNVSKTFAMVQIYLGNDKAGKPIHAWIDGRDMITAKKAAVKGLGTANLVM